MSESLQPFLKPWTVTRYSPVWDGVSGDQTPRRSTGTRSLPARGVTGTPQRRCYHWCPTWGSILGHLGQASCAIAGVGGGQSVTDHHRSPMPVFCSRADVTDLFTARPPMADLLPNFQELHGGHGADKTAENGSDPAALTSFNTFFAAEYALKQLQHGGNPHHIVDMIRTTITRARLSPYWISRRVARLLSAAKQIVRFLAAHRRQRVATIQRVVDLWEQRDHRKRVQLHEKMKGFATLGPVDKAVTEQYMGLHLSPEVRFAVVEKLLEFKWQLFKSKVKVQNFCLIQQERVLRELQRKALGQPSYDADQLKKDIAAAKEKCLKFGYDPEKQSIRELRSLAEHMPGLVNDVMRKTGGAAGGDGAGPEALPGDTGPGHPPESRAPHPHDRAAGGRPPASHEEARGDAASAPSRRSPRNARHPPSAADAAAARQPHPRGNGREGLERQRSAQHAHDEPHGGRPSQASHRGDAPPLSAGRPSSHSRPAKRRHSHPHARPLRDRSPPRPSSRQGPGDALVRQHSAPHERGASRKCKSSHQPKRRPSHHDPGEPPACPGRVPGALERQRSTDHRAVSSDAAHFEAPVEPPLALRRGRPRSASSHRKAAADASPSPHPKGRLLHAPPSKGRASPPLLGAPSAEGVLSRQSSHNDVLLDPATSPSLGRQWSQDDVGRSPLKSRKRRPLDELRNAACSPPLKPQPSHEDKGTLTATSPGTCSGTGTSSGTSQGALFLTSVSPSLSHTAHEPCSGLTLQSPSPSGLHSAAPTDAPDLKRHSSHDPLDAPFAVKRQLSRDSFLPHDASPETPQLNRRSTHTFLEVSARTPFKRQLSFDDVFPYNATLDTPSPPLKQPSSGGGPFGVGSGHVHSAAGGHKKSAGGPTASRPPSHDAVPEGPHDEQLDGSAFAKAVKRRSLRRGDAERRKWPPGQAQAFHKDEVGLQRQPSHQDALDPRPSSEHPQSSSTSPPLRQSQADGHTPSDVVEPEPQKRTASTELSSAQVHRVRFHCGARAVPRNKGGWLETPSDAGGHNGAGPMGNEPSCHGTGLHPQTPSSQPSEVIHVSCGASRLDACSPECQLTDSSADLPASGGTDDAACIQAFASPLDEGIWDASADAMLPGRVHSPSECEGRRGLSGMHESGALRGSPGDSHPKCATPAGGAPLHRESRSKPAQLHAKSSTAVPKRGRRRFSSVTSPNFVNLTVVGMGCQAVRGSRRFQGPASVPRAMQRALPAHSSKKGPAGH